MKRLTTPLHNLIFTLCLLALGSAVLSGCAGHGERLELKDTLYTPLYAKGFTITGDSTGQVLITTMAPWGGASEPSQLLITAGNEAPEGFGGQALKAPAKRVIAMASTQVAFLRELGALDRLVGVSGKHFMSDPWVHSQNLPDVGEPGNANYETILALKPDLILLYGVESSNPMEGKLKELGIPYLYIAEHLEQHPLGKAEWMVPLAYALGVEQKAQQAFTPIATSYNTLAQKVQQASATPVPVMFNAPFAGQWFVPNNNSYLVKLVTDAGGRFVYTDNNSDRSQPISLETAAMLMNKAQYWLNPGEAESIRQLTDQTPVLAQAPCIRHGNVFNNNARRTPGGGNDYYESGVVRPHILLADLLSILHPEISSDTLTYYKRLP